MKHVYFQRFARARWLLTTLATLAASPVVLAHGSAHHTASQSAAVSAPVPQNTPGFPDIKGGDFSLIDQNGHTRTSRDPEGHHQLLFFGYAKCKAICSVALPRMAEAVDLLARQGLQVTPVLITVDPERDTVAELGPAVAKLHPRMVGLTGDIDALGKAWKAFHVERKVVFEHPEYGAVYAHGSYLYLLGPDGSFETLFPPILSPERIAEITAGYMTH